MTLEAVRHAPRPNQVGNPGWMVDSGWLGVGGLQALRPSGKRRTMIQAPRSEVTYTAAAIMYSPLDNVVRDRMASCAGGKNGR